MKKMVILRRLSQTVSCVLFIYVLWSTTYPLAGTIKPAMLFKSDPLMMAMVSISQRVILPGVAISIAMLLIAAALGRYFCGWVCPLGAAMDITAALKKKHAILSDNRSAALRKIKFFFLGAFLILALAGIQVAWICDPVTIAARFVSMNMIPALTWAADRIFIFLIRDCNMHGAISDLYHTLESNLLGVKVFYFAHSAAILSFFAAICAASFILQRFWCRAVCPLGALYSLAGRFSRLRRTTGGCVKCGRCVNSCRMGAIKKDFSYSQGECILCMECIYDCPSHVTKFGFSGASRPPVNTESRKNFILILLSSLFTMGFAFPAGRKRSPGGVIRPPAALEEDHFVNRCIRCGNCMKVCQTNGLQPVMFQAGPGGIWTPQLVPETGYCEYLCTLCGKTCPTGAIPEITQEQKAVTKLGIAEIDRSTCLPWAKNKECIVCQEHCPVGEKAIKLDTYAGGPAKPYIDERLCVGCGICQNKCPVQPVRAVKVSPRNADRKCI